DLGDEVTLLPGACECGSAMLRVADIAGRRDDDFRYGGRPGPASAVRYVLGTAPRVSAYQGHPTHDRAHALLRASPPPSSLTAALAAQLAPYGLADPGITVRVVDQIPRHASTGKLKRFIALSG